MGTFVAKGTGVPPASVHSFEQAIKLGTEHPEMVTKLQVCWKLASQNDGRVPVVEAQAQGLTLDDLELLREYGLPGLVLPWQGT